MFRTGCQVVFAQIGKDGKAAELNKVFTTADGHSGIPSFSDSASGNPKHVCFDQRSRTPGVNPDFRGEQAMPLETFRISDEQRKLLDQLCQLIPDLDAEAPENMQRIFSLGLFALVMQAAGENWGQNKDKEVRKLVGMARRMIRPL